MFDILSIVPGRKRKTPSGWYTFNAICCIHFGHRADRRSRGGIKMEGPINFSYHCFNCGFKTSFKLGKTISADTRKLLEWCGIESILIQKWSLESLQHKDLLDYTEIKKRVRSRIKFKEKPLPDGEFLDDANPLHKEYIDYLRRRGLNHRDYPFMITPHDHGRQAKRIIIPYTHDNKIVGYISRFLDDRIPKYIKEQQTGYVFGCDFQKPDWPIVILTEGVFDALSLNACALTHNEISPEQIEVIAGMNKQVIFVPHQDKSGLPVCDHALELGYKVSIPNWAPGIKDINEAVVQYGRLPTLLSILQSATTSPIKIELKRKQLAKRL